MSVSGPPANLPPDQEAIHARCFHPNGEFEVFAEEQTERSIPARFEEIVVRYPNRMAVKTAAEQLTYDELNRRANRLARVLLTASISAEHPVALFLERGLAPITANIAVLKTGHFSLHAEPAADAARTTHVFRDCEPTVVVTNERNLPHALALRDGHRLRFNLINMDEPPTSLPDTNPALVVDPESAAYIRYTSGSTGSAKPVLKTHRHVMHDVMNFTNYFHLCPDDRITMLGQDYLGKHVFQALLNGGAIFPLDLRTEASVKFADWIAREQITVYQSSPTAFRNLIGLAHESHDFSNLRLIRLDGESVYKSDVELYRGAFSSRCILVNSYSSTETGTISVYYIDKTSELSGTQAPAGYPVSGKEIFLLDSHGREVGTAGQGEVSVRSRFLAPGYWRRPELTAEKFLDDGTDGARSYRTGDFGQRAEPGCLELMGRKDFRVKIRNFSVDLGEIEGVLTTHPDVKHAAVIREHEVEPEPRIVAYIVPQNEAAPTPSHLRRFVKERLPDYMIPSLFVFLGEIPVLSSGKIDRRALPDPGRFRPNLDLPYCPPETALERQLAEIWARVLSVEPIGIHDSFFDLGGHSLAATRIVSQIIRTLRVEIPPAILFGAPTVAQMALAISDHQCKKMHVGLEELIDQIEALREDEARDFVPRAREP